MKSIYWKQSQVKAFAKQLLDEYGVAWEFFVPRIREALVEAKLMAIFRGCDRDAIPMGSIDDLTIMLHVEVGTRPAWGE